MKRCHLITGAAFAVLLAASASRADESSAAVTLADLPPAVHKTVQKELGKGKVDSIEKVTDEDGVTYDVEMTKNGRTRDFTVDDDGKLLEIQVFPVELPKSVHEALTREAGKVSIEYISKVFDDGVTFDIEVSAGATTRSFTFDPKGTLLEKQVLVSETPSAVQKAIQKEAQNNKIEQITKVFDDGAVSYDLEITTGGKSRVISLAEDGTVNDREVVLTDLSSALQKSIQALTGTDKLGDIHQATEDGKTIYEVELDSADGTPRYTTVGADGATLYSEEDIDLTNAPTTVQQAIKDRMGDGELVGITKTTEGGDISYDVDVKKSGKQESFSLDADGKVLPDE